MSDVHAGDPAVTPPQEGESEVKARRLGWVAKEEFRGDPDKWRPAEEFLERGERILPILQRDNDKLHRRLSEVETLLKETREATQQFVEFASKAEERSYERAKSEIQAKIEQGAANADPSAVRAAVAELDNLTKSHTAAPKVEAKTEPRPQVDPEIQDWIGREQWFNKDRTLNVYATDLYGELERQHPGMSVADKLAETKKRTLEKFPEKFGINPQRDNAAAVAEPGGKPTTRKRGKTYDDLPDEAKRACDRFVKMIPGYKREQYVKDYEWNEA